MTIQPPPGFTLDEPTIMPPPGFVLDGARPLRPPSRVPSLYDYLGADESGMLPGRLPGPSPVPSVVENAPAPKPPFVPYDPHGIDFPRDTSIWSGIKERGVDLFKGGVTTADYLARGLTKMEADIAASRGRATSPLPTHGLGLAPGSPMGAFIKPPQLPTIPDPQPNYLLTELENVKKEIGYKPKITWAEVKQSSNPLDWGRFILQEGLISTPDMAAVLISTPTYIFARTGSLAEERTKNQGRNVVTGDDIMWALPTAVAAGAMERTGTRGIFFGTGQTVGKRIAKAGAKEATTEAGQEAAEYTGTTFDTKKKFDVAEMLDRMAAGAVVGGPFGASLRTGVEGVGAGMRGLAPPAYPGAPQFSIPPLRGPGLAPPLPPGPVPNFTIPPLARPEAPPSSPADAGDVTPPPGFILDREGFTRDRLSMDGWTAEPDRDAGGPDRMMSGATQHWNVTGPTGENFYIGITPQGGALPDGSAISPANARNWVIREAQSRAAGNAPPSLFDQPPPRATRTGAPLRTELGRALPPVPVDFLKDTIAPTTAPRPANLPNVPRPPAEGTSTMRAGLQPMSAFKKQFPPANDLSKIGPATQSVDRLTPNKGEPAFTPAGRRVDVNYEVVDLDQLTTSHDDDLRPSPLYPAELQPRDRERAASVAQITEIAARLEPERLGKSKDTTTGAPIVGPDLVVDSGNARILGLRRAYAQHPERARAYRAWLEQQGYNVEGVARPVLVARRVSKLSPQERVEFTRESNEATALRMSAPEQAKADAEIVKPIVDQFRGGDVTFAQNAGFVRSFLQNLPASERGALWTDAGGLSQDGARRIQAALLHAAYENSALVSSLMEATSTDIKSIGGALLDIAPAWAKMRARAARGEISSDVDRTKDLMTAVETVDRARRAGMLPSDLFRQGGLFGSIDAARDFAGMFFNDAAMKQPASRQSVAGRLRKYIEQANLAHAGRDLLGQEPATAKDILGATKGKEIVPPDGFTLDEPGGGFTLRSGFDPTKPYQWYQRQAQKVLDFIHQKGGYKLAPLRNLPQESEYLAKRYEALGKLAEVDKIAHRIFKAFRGLSKRERDTVYDFMTTAHADPATIANPRVRADAVEAKNMIDAVGRALVSRGMLPEEVRAEHAGAYLPRIYLKHLLGDRMTRGRTKLDLGYLKKRQDIPFDVRRLILGEITDPGYLSARGYNVPMRDMIFADFLEQLSSNNEWVLRDSMVEWEGQALSAAWLWHEAQRLRTMAEHVESRVDEAEILRVASEMEAVARPALAISKVEGFKQVPDSPKYGKLRGVWLRKEIWNDLFGNLGFLVDDPSFAERLLGQQGYISRATQIWKLLKVPLNPPTLVRNTVGNIMLLQFSGVPLIRLPDRLIQAMIEMAANGRHWKIAKQYGVTETNFAHAELYRLDRFARYALAQGNNPIRKLAALAAGFADGASRFYGMLEAVAKTAKIIDAIEREGKTPEQAALDAHQAIFDYSLIPQTIRYLRNAPIGMPFVTFNYKVAPRLIELVTKHPWRVWPYVGAAMLLPALALDGLDIDEEEYKALKKSLPKWMRERGHVFILPWRDDRGRFQAVDVSSFMPWNWFADVGREAAKGDVGGTIHKSGFGGPFAQTLIALESNVDPFTGRQIVNPADPYAKRLWSSLVYAWKLAGPPWLADQGAAWRTKEAMEGRVDPRTGAPGLSESQAAARFFGVNIYPHDPQQAKAGEFSRLSREMRDIQRRMGQVLFDKNLTPDQRKAEAETYKRHLQEKAQELRDYSRDTMKAPRVPRPALPPLR